MTEYQCQTCKVITTIRDDESWYSILKAHRERHLGTRWGPSYEFCRFEIYQAICGRVDKKWNFKTMKYDYITCHKPAPHTVAFGEFGGMPLCDEHYNEHKNDKKQQELFARVR